MQVIWQDPNLIPSVNLGEEKEFWVAVKLRDNKIVTFLAQYQNRPFDTLLDVEDYDGDALVDVDGEYIHSVGWVSRYSHVEFDNYYEPITFSETYELVAWAEYQAPYFNADFNSF